MSLWKQVDANKKPLAGTPGDPVLGWYSDTEISGEGLEYIRGVSGERANGLMRSVRRGGSEHVRL